MQEILDQIVTHIRAAWQYRWYAMALSWGIVIIGWAIVFRLPDLYEANARVYVDTQSVIRPLLRGLAIQSNVSQRLQLMTKSLLSRPNIKKVAQMADLDINAKTPEQMESLLNKIAGKLTLASTRRENLYTIAYNDKDPVVAKKVVQSLLTIFVESALGDSRKDASSAQKFLVQQIAEYEARLLKAEEELKEFKRKNYRLMSGQGDYFQRLQAARTQYESTQLLYAEARNRRDELKKQLKGEEPVFGLGGSQSIGAASHSLDPRIQSLRQNLDSLLLKYTEAHPSVVTVNETIARLEKQKQEELEALPEGDRKAPGLQENPVYQQLKVSLGQAEANFASLRARLSNHKSVVTELEKAVNTIPAIEAALTNLNRDYANNKKNYDLLVARRESAKMGEEVEQSGDDVKFKVIDPPRVPLTPSGPNRPLFSSIVLVLGLAGGLGLSFLLSQIRPMLYDRRTLRQVTGYPVFGAISRVWTPELLFKRRLEFGAFISVGVLMLLSYTAILLLFGDGIAGVQQMMQSLKERL